MVQNNEIKQSLDDTNIEKRKSKNLGVKRSDVKLNILKKRRKKKKDLILYKYLKKKSQLEWNKKGEILFNQNPIKGSNIVELVNDALKTNSQKPKGYKFFYKQMKKINIPKRLLKK